MDVFKKVLEFIGGKSNGRFDKAGQIQNTFKKQKWKAWEARFLNNPKYNWRSHKGTEHAGLKEETGSSKP